MGKFGDIKRGVDIIKNTIGKISSCEPESNIKTQRSKFDMMDKCNAFNKQDFNAVWGSDNYEEYRSCKPGDIWNPTTGFMKLVRGNDLMGK